MLIIELDYVSDSDFSVWKVIGFTFIEAKSFCRRGQS